MPPDIDLPKEFYVQRPDIPLFRDIYGNLYTVEELKTCNGLAVRVYP
jgi:hypothetical protein